MSAPEKIEDILAVAVHAPSGDNAQPWEFRVDENSISLCNVAGRDATLYNFRERGSYLAHGAVLENICIAASRAGFHTSVGLFPENACTARVSLAPSAPTDEPLYEAILERATNRKPYALKKLEAVDRDRLVQAIKGYEGVSLRLIEDEAAIAALAENISRNEQLLFENKDLHDFLFGMIRWTPREETERPGLYVKTMEFPPPLQFLLKYAFRHWNIVKALNKIGLSRAIPKQSSQLYRASSAIGAIIIRSEENAAFVMAGRAFQRLWLTATKNGLSVQPVTAMPYLFQRLTAGEATMFTEEHKRIIRSANESISRIFNLRKDERIAMLFRVGYGEKPTARSAKMPPAIRR